MRNIFIAAALLAAPGLADAQTLTGTQYVAMAGASDQYELRSSKLVLATTRNAGLRRFANEMVTAHTQSSADVKRAAQRGGVMAGPPHLDAMGARNIAQLSRTRGPARDALYIQQQKKAHQQALDVQQGYAENGRVAPLKMAAAKITPVVQHHIDMLANM